MARSASNQSIAHVIDESVRSVVAGVLPSLQRALNAAVDGRVRAELASRKIPRGRRAPSRRAGEITRWVADNRAPRAPTFVIEATRLNTKRKIVAKYGPNAASAKGKSFPPVKLATAMPAEQSHKGEVKAKPPVIRKAAAATKWQSVPKE